MVLAALPVPDLPDAGTATLDPRIVWVAIATVVVCALFASADADRWTGALRGTLVGGALPTLGVAAAVLAMRAAGAAYPSDLTRFSAMLALPALSGALGAMCVLTAAVRSGQPPRRARFAATVAVAVVALGATMLPTIRATSAGTGNSELRANRPDRAVTLFEAAVASRPDNPGRQIALSRARRVLAASPEINEIAVLDAAQGDLAASLARRPLVPGLHLEYAAVLTMRALRGTEDPIEALDRAIEHLRRAQALQPRAAETGMALQATIGLREALEQASGEPPSRNRRRP